MPAEAPTARDARRVKVCTMAEVNLAVVLFLGYGCSVLFCLFVAFGV